MPEVRSASIACCRMITAATWSTMGRCFRDDLPDALSACCALTVERRSSTSRTGAPASANRWAKPIASSVEAVGVPESESGLPTTSSTTSYSSASSRMRRTSASPSETRATVSTGTASTAPASHRATPMRTRPTSMPSLAPARMTLPAESGTHGLERGGDRRDVVAAALSEVGLATATTTENPGHRLRERTRVRARITRSRRCRHDRERLSADDTGEGDDGCRIAELPPNRERERTQFVSGTELPDGFADEEHVTHSRRLGRECRHPVLQGSRLERLDALLCRLQARHELADPVDELVRPRLQGRRELGDERALGGEPAERIEADE